MLNSLIARFGMPLSKVIALDRNICIYINENTSTNITDELKIYDKRSTLIITYISFIEAIGKKYRNSELDYDNEYIKSLTEESITLSKFFKYALTDIQALKENDKSRQENEIGIDDFKFKNQIKFHKYLIQTINKTPPKSQIKNVFYKILQKAESLNLRYYFPIVINAIASLYQIEHKNYAKKLLKLKECESFNVVSDMTHPLRAISLGYKFILMCNVLNRCEFCFFTNDKYLRNFLYYIDYYKYFLKITGSYDINCPIDKDYFGNIPDKEWDILRKLLISGNYATL